MGSSFLNNLNYVFSIDFTSNKTKTVEECRDHINHYTFYQFTLIPAVLITMTFAVTRRRRNILLDLFNGRPGLVYPMDMLTRSSRFSYACSFGATAVLVYNIVLEGTFAIKYDGDTALKSLIAIISMFIYGMVFLPLFASLTMASVYGYTLGSLYVWMLTAVEIYRLFECHTTPKGRVLIILNGLPNVACLVYLSVSIPIRMVKAFQKGRYFIWVDSCEKTMTLQDIRNSYAGLHVAQLFKKPVIELPPETKKGRILGALVSLFHRLIYQNKRGFRYPARIIAVMIISILVVYSIMFQLMTLLPWSLAKIRDGLGEKIAVARALQSVANDTQNLDDLIIGMELIQWIAEVTRVCVIVGNVLATVLTVINVLRAMSNYRLNLLAMYKGDCSRIPPASTSSNASHCVNSIKYAGFQVGYIIWCYLIQLFILTLLAFLLAMVFILIANGYTDWLVEVLKVLGPVVLTAVLMTIVNLLLAKFVFLQERGRVLALNNRSLYFNYTYFMFFYNIFMGLASCFLRILKSMVVGIIFLSRLDNSTMPRRFEFIDPGFKAYVGYMQIEAAHTHPVVLVFARLMLLGLQNKEDREKERQLWNGDGTRNNHSGNVELKFVNKRVSDHPDVSDNDGQTDVIEAQRKRSAAARFNWHVAYTLLHNPEIRVLCKGYLQVLNQAKQLGIYIPISDQQADINFDDLLAQVNEAKERPQQCGLFRKKDTGTNHNESLTEVTVEDPSNTTDTPKSSSVSDQLTGSRVSGSDVTSVGASAMSETERDTAKLIHVPIKGP